MTQEHEDGPDDERQRDDNERDDEHQTADALRVRHVRPVLLFLQDGIQPQLVAMVLLCGSAQLRQPFHREHDARFAVLAAGDLVHLVDHGAVGGNVHRAVQRAMAPRTQVVAGLHLRADGHRRVDGARHVLGIRVPAGSDVLPVDLAHILVRDGRLVHRVIDGHGHILVVGVAEEHVQAGSGLVVGPRVLARATGFAPRRLERNGAQLLRLRRRLLAGIVLRNLHGVHGIAVAVRLVHVRRFEIPVHAAIAAVE